MEKFDIDVKGEKGKREVFEWNLTDENLMSKLFIIFFVVFWNMMSGGWCCLWVLLFIVFLDIWILEEFRRLKESLKY